MHDAVPLWHGSSIVTEFFPPDEGPLKAVALTLTRMFLVPADAPKYVGEVSLSVTVTA